MGDCYFPHVARAPAADAPAGTHTAGRRNVVYCAERQFAGAAVPGR